MLIIMLPQVQLPLYQSHKQVRAAKILEVGTNLLQVEVETDVAVINVSKEYLEKHKPAIGGYYVQYKDGYESWSPAEPFEEGYTLIKDVV